MEDEKSHFCAALAPLALILAIRLELLFSIDAFFKIAEGMSDKILDDFKGLFFVRVLLRRLASWG